MQKVKKTMPSRTGIPPDAQAEILQKLSAETKITSCEIAEILKKHDVCGDMDALQDAYRKRLGQRLLSGIRIMTAISQAAAATFFILLMPAGVCRLIARIRGWDPDPDPTERN